MKSITKSITIALLAFCVGCMHIGFKKQKKTVDMGISSVDKVSVDKASVKKDISLNDYIGNWKVEKETYGCAPIQIEKGPEEGTVKIKRRSAVYTVSKNSPFDSLPEHQIGDYYKYKLSGSALSKFIRGKIVSAHIWNPDTNDWLGVGLRTWTLVDKGTLIKKKAGVTMQNKSNDPREKASYLFHLDGDDVILKWEVECKYIKSPGK